jgi:hypothetical protein
MPLPWLVYASTYQGDPLAAFSGGRRPDCNGTGRLRESSRLKDSSE